VAIVGGGIVGLATGLRLLERRPQLRLVLLERESELAMHQSGHNSGVVHAGLYYAPGSVKARLCRQGKAQLETYCERKGIPIQQPGKLVIAATVDELARLDTLRDRAEANGVPGLELIGPEQIREHEPHATGLRALWSPTTGIVDFRRVALAYAEDVRALGGTIETSRPVTAVRRRGSGLVLSTPHGALTARSIIVCAGLWADSVAALTGDAGPDAPRIIPFRGDYYTLTPDARPLVQGLIYPVPDPRFPFLGVHLTKRHDGEVWAGPNAVLAFKRTGYRRRDVSLRDLASILTYRGFLRLAARYYRVGAAEMWRDWSKRAFLAEIRRYVPDVRANQLMFGPSGVRAQALRPNGTLVDDFDLAGSGRVLHVRNAPSPAATSSLAIATELARAAMERFELG
jgi:L-2-hydroxyglutarate oxidase LhgO